MTTKTNFSKLIDILQWSHQWFETKEIPSARREAEILLAHCLGLKRIELYMYYDRELTEAEKSQFKAMIQRRAQNEPSDYILGSVSFMDQEFTVNKNVLIPRPETEELINLFIEENKGGNYLEIGSGSGIIACSIAKHINDSSVSSCDVSTDALAVAKQNAQALKLDEKITFKELNYLEQGSDAYEPNTFDAIISNPPYVAESDIAGLDSEVKDHEPHLALIGGGEFGESFILNMIPIAMKQLKPEGKLYIEIGYNQRAPLSTALSSEYEDSQWEIKKDMAGHDRFLIIKAKV